MAGGGGARQQRAALTLQDTGVFPSFLLKFSRESKVSWLVDDVAMTCEGRGEGEEGGARCGEGI